MRRRILTYLTMFLAVTAAAVFQSCSVDNGQDLAAAEGVTISFRVSGADITTRAETQEAGWAAWNENTVSRLDAFIFAADSSLKHHCGTAEQTDLGGEWHLTVTAADGTETPLRAKDLESTDIVYLVANHDFTSSSISSVKDLQGLTFDLQSSAVRAQQSSFIMDGQALGSAAAVSGYDTYGNAVSKTLAIDLRRALSKICLRVNYTPVGGTASQLTDFTAQNISVRLMNYSSSSAVVSDGDYMPSRSVAEDGTVTVTGLVSEAEYSSEYLMYPGTGETAADELGSRAVFYVCANDWNDTTKTPYSEVPIFEDMQTHIMLQVGNGSSAYEYKIPLNYLLPENNDQVNLPYDSYSYLYKTERNHIYNVLVRIVEQENASPTVTVIINDWINGWDEGTDSMVITKEQVVEVAG